MRPIKLHLQYFGPYEETWIDFQRFNESKLFLITGDTGAGKTTMFDGMTFALFGEGTSARQPEEMRSEFAPNTKETCVTFWFEHNGHYYKIMRKPKQLLKKKRGAVSDDDVTSQVATVSFSEVDETLTYEQQALGAKISVVNKVVADLLHLDAAQFRKIILLPQNEFREFLAAKSDERMKILRTLFGTEIFNDFTASLKQQQQETLQETNKLKDERQWLLRQFDWPEHLAHYAELPVAEQTALIVELVANLTKQATDLATTEAAIKKQVNEADQALQAAKELTRQFEQLAEVKAQRDKLHAQQAEIDEQIATVTNLRWVNQQQPLVKNIQSYEHALAENQDTLTEIETKLTDAKTQYEQFTKQLVEQEAKADEITHHRERLQLIQNQLLPNARQLETLQADDDKDAAQQKSLTATLDARQNEQIMLQEKVTQQTEQVATLSALIVKEPDFIAWQYQLKQLLDLANEVQTHQTTIATQKVALATATENYRDLQRQNQSLHQAQLEQATLRQTLMIKQLQTELHDGEACPVCGVIYTQDATDEHTTATLYDDIKVAMAKVDELDQQLQENNQALSEANVKVDQLTKQIAEEQTIFAAIQADIKKGYQQLQTDWANLAWDGVLPAEFEAGQLQQIQKEASATLAQNKTAHERLQRSLVTIDDQLRTLDQEMIKNKATYSELQQRIATRKEKRDALQGDTPLASVTEYETEQAALTATLTQYEKLVQQLQQDIAAKQGIQTTLAAQKEQSVIKLSEIQETLTQLQQQLAAQIAAGPLQDKQRFDDLQAQLLADPQYLSNLEHSITVFQTTLRTTEEQLKKLMATIGQQTAPDLAALTTILQEHQLKLTDIQADVQKAKLTLENARHNQTQLLATEQKIAQVTQSAEDLMRLTDAVDGNNKHKLRLEPFILRSFLYEVLDYANLHYIGDLSAGRYQFILSNRRAAHANQNGLDIDIYDQDAGKVRSTNTLSGGESFIAALSIALSMAEVVQRRAGGAQIEALFIDEGFGSLDANTLQQAMEALTTVEQSGRLVGVISHVDSMKQQIQQQLVVRKRGNGRSDITYRQI